MAGGKTDVQQNWNKHRDLFEDLGIIRPNITSLNMGAPGHSCLISCKDMIAKATQHKMSTQDAEYLFQYGPRQGDHHYREALARYLSQGYGDTVNSNNLMLTAGATHGLFLVATLMFDKGATLFVEDPTYFIAITMLRNDLGMNIVPVPTDENGTDLDELDRLLTEHKQTASNKVTDAHPFWSMVYLVPTFNNPTGRSLPPDRCRRLVEIGRKHNVLLFCDDVYNLLNYDTKKLPPKRLLTYDNSSHPDYKGNVLSNGTFSKILGPGIRAGWFEGDQKIINLLSNTYTLWSGGAVNHYVSGLLGSAMDLGLLTQHVTMLQAKYTAHLKAVCKILSENLPKDVTFQEPKGGYFIWIVMPDRCNADDLKEICNSKYNVDFTTGKSCSPRGGYMNCIRISISYYDQDVLTDAVMKLCKAIQEYLESLK